MKKIIFKLVKKLVLMGLDYLYNYIDTNRDGKLSKKELSDFHKKIRRFKK